MDSMDNVSWQGNSRKMYEAVLSETPSMFRRTVKRRIAEWIAENKITVISEDTVFMAVDEIAPESLAKRIRPELEKLKS